MKINVSKEWCMHMAALEDGCEIGAGATMQPHEYVILEIARERERQMSVEGWTLEHDDSHRDGAMALAAATYAARASSRPVLQMVEHGPVTVRVDVLKLLWPWSHGWWKSTTPRRNLVKAAALIVAEIERLDRAASRQAYNEQLGAGLSPLSDPPST